MDDNSASKRPLENADEGPKKRTRVDTPLGSSTSDIPSQSSNLLKSQAEAAARAAAAAAMAKAKMAAISSASGKSSSTVATPSSVVSRPLESSSGREKSFPPPLMVDSSGKVLNAASFATDTVAAAPRQVKAGSGESIFAAARKQAAADAAVTTNGKINPYLKISQELSKAKNEESTTANQLMKKRLRLLGRTHDAPDIQKYNAREEEERLRALRSKRAAFAKAHGSRNRPLRSTAESGEAAPSESLAENMSESQAEDIKESLVKVPPRHRLFPPPILEWWDASFLPLTERKQYESSDLFAITVLGRRRSEFLIPAAGSGTDLIFPASAHSEEVKNAVFDTPSASSLNSPSFASHLRGLLDLEQQQTSQYVQHPVPEVGVPALAPPEGAIAVPLMLLPSERRRARRLRRLEAQRFTQEQIRLGLMEPPPPRLKMSNIMKIMKDLAVTDPSKVEEMVRQQAAERLARHVAENNAQQLTKEQRIEKLKKKLMKTGAYGPSCAFFRTRAIHDDMRAKFLIDVTAKECGATGICLQIIPKKNADDFDDSNGLDGEPVPETVIAVEGGILAVKKFIAVMTKRIDWTKKPKNKKENDINEDEEEDEEEESEDDDDEFDEYGLERTISKTGVGPGGICELLWNGFIPKPRFEAFRFEAYETGKQARKSLDAFGLSQLWDLAVASIKSRTNNNGSI